jgi:hypothetical protein
VLASRLLRAATPDAANEYNHISTGTKVFNEPGHIGMA